MYYLMQEKIKNALKKRILSYKNRKQLNIKLSDLIAYDSILFFKKIKEEKLVERFLHLLAVH